MSLPPGLHDYSGVRLTHHALSRFAERFAPPGISRDELGELLRQCLRRAKRLGRNPSNGAVAALALYGDRMLVAIVQEAACLTVLTWPQFEPRLPEFGRARLPRKRSRMLSRLKSKNNDSESPGPDPDHEPQTP